MSKKDKFNGWYTYGMFPNISVKSNFTEEFLDDYYDELHGEEFYFITIVHGRKVEFGLIGRGYYVSFMNQLKETYEQFADRMFNSNCVFRLQPSKNTSEEYEEMLENFPVV